MNVFNRSWECLPPWPAVVSRTAALVWVLVFVLVLVRWGYDPRTTLVTVSTAGLLAARVTSGRRVRPD